MEACERNFEDVMRGWPVALMRGEHQLTDCLLVPVLYYAAYTCEEESLDEVQKVLRIFTDYLTALQKLGMVDKFCETMRKAIDVVQDAFIIGCCYQVR